MAQVCQEYLDAWNLVREEIDTPRTIPPLGMVPANWSSGSYVALSRMTEKPRFTRTSGTWCQAPQPYPFLFKWCHHSVLDREERTSHEDRECWHREQPGLVPPAQPPHLH